MRRLSVDNFSVIKTADLEFGKLTVLIGPQSSGKSLLCKLSFFAHDLLRVAVNTLQDGGNYDRFQQVASEEFIKLFPVQAWGSKPFKIFYGCGQFNVEISRRTYKGKLKEKPTISMPKSFSDLYADFHNQMTSKKERLLEESLPLENLTQARSFTSAVIGQMGSDAFSFQQFIPAGRSFFSSVGKALAVFEEGGAIDPLTLRFGRSVRWDYASSRFNPRSTGLTDVVKLVREESASLLGGNIKEERGRTVFVANDGRLLPLSNLSSGQQELLPLISTLARRISFESSQMLYIEEPEAHLFPSAQASLVSIFSLIAQHAKLNVSMVLTTHSPYILAKFNNLIKAGELGKKRALRDKVDQIIKSPFWVKEGALVGYSIEEGKTRSIIDQNGLIDGEYLDQISEVIGREFDALLRLQYDQTKS